MRACLPLALLPDWLVDRVHGLAAFLAYGIGGLAVPLALLFLWLRLRRPHISTGAALHDN
jgi:hypothetical protein